MSHETQNDDVQMMEATHQAEEIVAQQVEGEQEEEMMHDAETERGTPLTSTTTIIQNLNDSECSTSKHHHQWQDMLASVAHSRCLEGVSQAQAELETVSQIVEGIRNRSICTATWDQQMHDNLICSLQSTLSVACEADRLSQARPVIDEDADGLADIAQSTIMCRYQLMGILRFQVRHTLIPL